MLVRERGGGVRHGVGGNTLVCGSHMDMEFSGRANTVAKSAEHPRAKRTPVFCATTGTWMDIQFLVNIFQFCNVKRNKIMVVRVAQGP